MPRGAPKIRIKGDYARVRIAGIDYYLGHKDAPETPQKYNQLLAAWIRDGRPIPWAGPTTAKAREKGTTLTVAELADAFTAHSEAYYRKGGKGTSEIGIIRAAMGALVTIHATTLVSEFGPSALREVRDHILTLEKKTGGGGKLSRVTVNKYVDRIRRAFKWGVSEEVVPPSVHHGLIAVDGLRKHRTAAPETDGVYPVPRLHVARAMRAMPRQVATMVRLQMLTAMRPGEVVSIRPRDIDAGREVWVYRPPAHKTEHHDRRREVFIGPRAQRILRRVLPKEVKAPVFSAVDGNAWTRDGYRRAITKACERATMRDGSSVPKWNPRQLRKNAGTRIRDRFGLDTAQAVLGHSHADTTEIYAEAERAKAIRAALELG